MGRRLPLGCIAAISWFAFGASAWADATGAPTPAASPTPGAATRTMEEMSLEELLNVPIAVAAKKAQTLREAPGVVTLVTHQEIVDSGARTLDDVLHLVPGFYFGVDVEGVTSLGFRGQWAEEGKALLLWDGMQMNEDLYANLPFGNHFPIDLIDRIEIIRGPGSAIYGGYAEMAVINIVTKDGKSLKGSGAASLLASSDFGQNDMTLAYGDSQGNWTWSLGGFIGQGQRSARTYYDFYGDSASMDNRSEMDPRFVDAALAWKKLSARVIYDGYHQTGMDGYNVVFSQAYATDFPAWSVQLSDEISLLPGLTITPRLSWKEITPWQSLVSGGDSPYYDKTVDRYLANLTASWDLSPQLNLLVGGEAYDDRARVNDPGKAGAGFETLFNGNSSVEYKNVAGFAQALWSGPVDLAVGARAENHSYYGSSFVPRLALTKVFGRYHAKLLYANSFRAPSVENINSNPNIKAETTTEYEAELGAKVGEGAFFTINAFDLTIKNPIVYAYLGTNAETYYNFDSTGSRGLEATLKLKYSWGHADLSWSYYNTAGKNNVPNYAVAGHSDVVLGFPTHKVTAAAFFNLTDRLGFGPSVIYMSGRWGYLTGDGAGNGILAQTPDTTLVNAMVSYRLPLQDRDLTLALAGYNVLNQPFIYVEPYQSGFHGPLPGLDRQLAVRISTGF